MAVERSRRGKWKAICVTIHISLSRVFQPKQFGRGEVINTKRQGFFMLYTRESLTALYVFYLFFSFSLFSFLFSFFFFLLQQLPTARPMTRKNKIGCIGRESNPDPYFLCVLCCVGICILRYAISSTCTSMSVPFFLCVLCWDLHITVCDFQHVYNTGIIIAEN